MHFLDLTRKMTEGMPVYPGDPFFQSRVVADHETDGFRVSLFSFGSHTGTHLDMPFHFFSDGETLDQFPLDLFVTSAGVIDLTPQLDSYRFGNLPPLIVPELLEPFLPLFQKADSVILKTGWSKEYGLPGYFYHFPSLLPETADWLLEQPFQILGLETPSLSSLANYEPEDGAVPLSDSLSVPADQQFFLHSDAESHRILLGRTPPIFLLENLYCPDELPAITKEEIDGDWEKKLWRLLAVPLPFDGADASPLRAAALFDSSREKLDII